MQPKTLTILSLKFKIPNSRRLPTAPRSRTRASSKDRPQIKHNASIKHCVINRFALENIIFQSLK